MIRHRLVSTAKDLVAGTLQGTGLLWHHVDRNLRGKVLVLMYHRVLPEHDRDSFSAPGIIVTPETFDSHLGWIRSHLNALTPAKFGDILEGKRPPPPRACLVTFDDGWHDNLTHALPALERHEVPAVLFASTGFIGTQYCFWQERISRLLHAAWKVGPHGADLLRQVGATEALNLTESQARRKVRDAVARLKALPPTDIITLLGQVEAGLADRDIALPADFGDDRFLSWAELQRMAASRHLTVGSHAVSHVPLPRLPANLREEELTQSRAQLSARLGGKIEWFAYPNGEHDAACAVAARGAGYRGAFTTQDGPVAPGSNAFMLQRVNMHEGSTRSLGRFLSRISGLL